MNETNRWFVYILKCRDGLYYTGYSNNVQRRIEVHNLGKGSRFTRVRLPVELIWQEELPSQSDALKREAEIKGWTRKKKEALINQ